MWLVFLLLWIQSFIATPIVLSMKSVADEYQYACSVIVLAIAVFFAVVGSLWGLLAVAEHLRDIASAPGAEGE